MKKLIIVFVLLLSALSCFSQIEFSTCLFDASRNRVIPLAVYQPHKVNSKTKVIIFSHGYDGNKNNKSNQTYAYLTRFLSQKGFYRFSILLVEPIRTLQSYVCGFEQVKLYVSSNIPFVTIDATVVISMFYILHIMEVSYTCL